MAIHCLAALQEQEEEPEEENQVKARELRNPNYFSVICFQSLQKVQDKKFLSLSGFDFKEG